MSALIRSNARDSIFIVLAVVIANFSYFLINIVLVRTLSPEDFGVFALLNGLSIIITIFSKSLSDTMEAKSASLRGQFEGDLNFPEKTLGRVGLISLLVILIWVFLIPKVSAILSVDPNVLLFFSPIIIFGLLNSVLTGFLNGHFKFRLLAIVIILESLIRTVIAVLFGFLNIPDLVYVSLPVSIGLSFVIGIYISKKYREERKINVEPKIDKNFYFSTFLINISALSLFAFDIVLIKALFDPKTAGYYATLSLLGKIIFFATTLFQRFILPFISYENGNNVSSSKTFHILLSGIVLSLVVNVFLMIVFIDSLLPFIFGPNLLEVKELIIPYILAIAIFSLAHSITLYHLAKKRLIFSALALFSIILIVFGIILNHETLSDVIEVMFVSSIFYIILVFIFHLFRENIFKIFNRTRLHFVYLGKLFSSLNLEKNSILFLNWRDIHHKDGGGAERYIHEIAKRLNQPVVLFTSHDGNTPLEETIDGIKIIRRGGFVSVYLYAFIYYIFRIRKYVEKIVDCHNGVPFFSPFYSRKTDILIIHHIHQEIFEKYLPKPLAYFACFLEDTVMPILYRKNKCVVVSDSTRKDAIDIGINPENIFIIHNGVDVEALPYLKKSIHPTLIYLGRIKRYKRIEKAINIFDGIREKYPDSRLYIVGQGDHLTGIRKYIRDRNLDQSVFLRGFVPEIEKIGLLQESWFLIQPSEMEGWGLTVIEANSCATPSIVFDVSGLRDSVIHNHSGYIIDSEEKAIERIITAIDRPEIFRMLCFRAREHSKKYTWDKSAEQFETILNNLLIS